MKCLLPASVFFHNKLKIGKARIIARILLAYATKKS